MSDTSITPSIEVTIGRQTRLYHAFITTAPAVLDAPSTVTLYAGPLKDIAGLAADDLVLDAEKAATPSRAMGVGFRPKDRCCASTMENSPGRPRPSSFVGAAWSWFQPTCWLGRTCPARRNLSHRSSARGASSSKRHVMHSMLVGRAQGRCPSRVASRSQPPTEPWVCCDARSPPPGPPARTALSGMGWEESANPTLPQCGFEPRLRPLFRGRSIEPPLLVSVGSWSHFPRVGRGCL